MNSFTFFRAGTLILLSLLTAASARSAEFSPDLTRQLAAAGVEQNLPVLVFMAEQVDFSRIPPGRNCARVLIPRLRETARRSQTELRAWLSRRGVGEVKSFWINNSLVFEAPAPLIRELRSLPGIAVIGSAAAPDMSRPPFLPLTDRTPLWNIIMVRADEVWEEFGLDGSGIVVGSVDSGVDPDHPALAGKWRGGDNSWLDTIEDQPYPYDDTGHGSHTIGTMVGGDGPGPFVFDIGLAYGAQFIATKVFDATGHPPDISYMFAGMQWLVDPDGDSETDDFPHVVNNSWVWSPGSTNFYAVLNFWRQVGIVPVFSIGNGGPAPMTTQPPGDYHLTFGVGATDASDLVADFSARGPTPTGYAWPPDRRKPDLSAPGVAVSSSLPGGGYAAWGGTSMAAPHVAGAVALLLQADPELTFDELRETLTLTAVDIDEPGYDYNAGHGRMDVHAAVSRVLLGTAAPESEPLRAGLTVSPNPFREQVRLSLSGARGVDSRLELFDVGGRRLRVLELSEGGAGVWIWDGRDERGRRLSSGVYMARLSTGGERFSRRLLLLR